MDQEMKEKLDLIKSVQERIIQEADFSLASFSYNVESSTYIAITFQIVLTSNIKLVPVIQTAIDDGFELVKISESKEWITLIFQKFTKEYYNFKSNKQGI